MSERLLTMNGIFPDRFLEWIMESAEDARDDYQADKTNEFYSGLAQAYSEVFDFIQDCYDIEGIKTDVDYKALAIEWFG